MNKQNLNETKLLFRCDSGRDVFVVFAMPLVLFMMALYEGFSHSFKGAITLLILSIVLLFVFLFMAIKKIQFYDEYMQILKFLGPSIKVNYTDIKIVKNVENGIWYSSNNIVILYNRGRQERRVSLTANATTSSEYHIPDIKNFLALVNMLEQRNVKVVFQKKFQDLLNKKG